MAQAEDVQYFQFDQHGNMYIFEPGAGCTGVPKLVQPGEELHLSSSSASSLSCETVKYDTQISSEMPKVPVYSLDIFQSQDVSNR